MTNDYETILLSELLENIGEKSTNKLLSDFSCEYKENHCNKETEDFLKTSAINFSKQKLSITYLVMNQRAKLIGFFTLTHKPVNIKVKSLSSNSQERKIKKYSTYDDKLKTYTASAFLLAQFSKNYALPPDERISGNELMNQVFASISDIQILIGGGIVFLEYEDKPGLSNFYENEPNNFLRFGKRYSEKDDKEYIQAMRLI